MRARRTAAMVPERPLVSAHRFLGSDASDATVDAMAWNGPERRYSQRRGSARQYGQRHDDVPVEQVHAAAARHQVEPGAPAGLVRAMWKTFVQASRPDLGRVDGADFAQRVADRDLLLDVARDGRDARRTRRESGLRRPDGTRVRAGAGTAGEQKAASQTKLSGGTDSGSPEQPRRPLSPRVAAVRRRYDIGGRHDPATRGGRVDLEL